MDDEESDSASQKAPKQQKADRYRDTENLRIASRKRRIHEVSGEGFSNGEKITVDVDGERVTNFDPASKDIPTERQWYEPRREPKRPTTGYIGLQTHDPGDTVWFQEISVRPLKK